MPASYHASSPLVGDAGAALDHRIPHRDGRANADVRAPDVEPEAPERRLADLGRHRTRRRQEAEVDAGEATDDPVRAGQVSARLETDPRQLESTGVAVVG